MRIMLLITILSNWFLTASVTVVHKWEMPSALQEISGIAWIEPDRFAGIQDEDGIIFIYNRATAQIEKRIPFAGKGDYEGITLVNDIAYVMRSDGMLYEVDNINNAQPRVKEYKTGLTAKQNVEGLTYDKKNNRLLAAIKDREPGDVSYKGIYAFDLAAKLMDKTPVYKLSLTDPALGNAGAHKKNKTIRPSEIAVHPASGDIYIIDATEPALIILTPSGEIKNTCKLPRNDFAQPEGMTFSPDGILFISNEGRKDAGNILEVHLNQ